MKVFEAFSFVIKRERANRGLTQQNVCDRGNLDITFLRDLEHARSQPSITTIFRVAQGLGVRPYDLMFFVEEVLAETKPENQ